MTVMDRVLRDTNIPASFRACTFDDYDPRRRRGANRAFRMVQEWEPSDDHPALVLAGPPGVGKTMLSSALLNEYHLGYLRDGDKVPEDRATQLMLQERCPVFFIQLAEFVAWNIRLFRLQDDVGRGIRSPDEYLELDQLLQDLQHRVKVLVIDDVGKEHRTGSGFAQDSFDLLVRTRHNAGLTTIYTTNLPIQRWSDQYSESMQSLIERSSRIVDF